MNAADVSYRGVTEADCPRLAARASTLGNMLDYKAQTSSPSGCKSLLRVKKDCDQSCVVLHLAAEDARNRTAGDAMEAFYRLVEAEGQLALLHLGVNEVSESLARVEEQQSKGLSPPVDIADIRKKLTDLRGDEDKLRISILQLNARLKVLLGLSCNDDLLWPLAELKVVPEATEIDQAVDYALSHRPDLALLSTLACCVDSESLAVANQVLATVNPLLVETPAPTCVGLLLAYFDGSKCCRTQHQLQTMLADRRRQATEEIRQAIGQVAYRVQLVTLARQKVEIEERRIEELEEKKLTGLDVEGELSTARLNLYEAQGEQLSEAVNWKIARAQLLQAQGRLLEEGVWIDNASAGATLIQPDF